MSNIILTPQMWVPTQAAEVLMPSLPKFDRIRLGKALRKSLKDRVMWMAGSDSFYLSKKLGDLIMGATAYTAPSPLYVGLWTATLDDTLNGGTTGESTYTSYARLSLTNNTTIFATGTGSTTYTKAFPADAAKSWPTSTGGTSTVTYLGVFDANAKTSGDNGILWASLTSTTINSGDTPQLAQNAISQIRD